MVNSIKNRWQRKWLLFGDRMPEWRIFKYIYIDIICKMIFSIKGSQKFCYILLIFGTILFFWIFFWCHKGDELHRCGISHIPSECYPTPLPRRIGARPRNLQFLPKLTLRTCLRFCNHLVNVVINCTFIFHTCFLLIASVTLRLCSN